MYFRRSVVRRVDAHRQECVACSIFSQFAFLGQPCFAKCCDMHIVMIVACKLASDKSLPSGVQGIVNQGYSTIAGALNRWRNRRNFLRLQYQKTNKGWRWNRTGKKMANARWEPIAYPGISRHKYENKVVAILYYYIFYNFFFKFEFGDACCRSDGGGLTRLWVHMTRGRAKGGPNGSRICEDKRHVDPMHGS
jgi:hypothetical protein